jgi:hypothetical protein
MTAAIVIGAYYTGVKGEKRSAFNRWRPQVLALWDGVDIYRTYAFPTPPVTAILLTPFERLPPVWGMAAWFAFRCTATVAAIAMLIAALRRIGPIPDWLPLAALAAASAPISSDLLHGNINLWILFLVGAGAAAWVAGREFPAGVAFGFAAACKVTPALLIVYLAWKRAWRGTIGGAVGLALGLAVVPGMILGFDRTVDLTKSWAEVMVWPYLRDGRIEAEAVNQSLPAVFLRWFTDVEAVRADDGAPAVQINVANLEPATAKMILKGMAAAIVASIGWISRRRATETSPRRRLHEIGLVLLAMLALSERSWKHHYAISLVSVVALLAEGAWAAMRAPPATAGLEASAHPAGRRRTSGRWLFFGLVGAGFILMALAGKDLVGERRADLAQAAGAYLAAACVLALGHLVACRIGTEPDPSRR